MGVLSANQLVQILPRREKFSRRRGPRYEKQFFFEIQEAILDGYRIADTDTLKDVSMRNYKGSIGRAVLYKEGEEPDIQLPVGKSPTESLVESEPDVVIVVGSSLETMTKKVDLLAHAKSLGLEIPEDCKAPLKIKKFIKDSLSK